MAEKTPLENGLALIRIVAESDMVKQVRGKIRQGASRLAESELLPRVVAGSAGILAALLTDSEDPDLDAVPEDYPLEQDAVGASASSQFGLDEDGEEEEEEEVFESVATVRDLEDSGALEEALEAPLADTEGVSDDTVEEATDVQLPYDAYRVTKAEDLVVEDIKENVASEPSRTMKSKSAPQKKKPVVKATKSANAAKGAAKKAAAKKAAKKVATPTKTKSTDAGKTAGAKADQGAKTQATKAVASDVDSGVDIHEADKAKAPKAPKTGQSKAEPKSKASHVVKRPTDRPPIKTEMARKKNSS